MTTNIIWSITIWIFSQSYFCKKQIWISYCQFVVNSSTLIFWNTAEKKYELLTHWITSDHIINDSIASINSTASAVGRSKNLEERGPFILIDFYLSMHIFVIVCIFMLAYISGIQCTFAPEANSAVCGSAYVIPKNMAVQVVEFSNEGYEIKKVFA